MPVYPGSSEEIALFDPILQKFAEKSPVTVMVRGVLERLFNANKIDDWFEDVRGVQYTKTILFSSLVAIMLQVVCRVKSTVHSAYLDSKINATRQAVYDKLKNTEVNTARELVRFAARESELIIKEMNGAQPLLLLGFKVKFLDGNCIEATDHRLGVLRETKAGALPGKSLVVFEPELGIATDVFPCEDGHAQERSLLNHVLETVEKDDLWVADRNFCTLGFLFGIQLNGAFFILRQHQNTPYKPLSEKVFIGESETGSVYEQFVEVVYKCESIQIRRIIVELNKATRNGDQTLCLFTNLPKDKDKANALKIAYIYSKRWTIETAFQKLEKYLNSEINALGYPKAALFGFCTALVAFNVYAVVMAAIQASNPERNIPDEISDYYIAEEISSTYNGMDIIVEPEDWSVFVTGSIPEVSYLLLYLAGNINLRKFKKHKREPKKPLLPKNKFKGQPHVSTAKLLLNRNKAP